MGAKFGVPFPSTRFQVKLKTYSMPLSALEPQFVVPEFFPFECSRICSTACGKAFILKVFVLFWKFCFERFLKARWSRKLKLMTLGVCRISDFWGVVREGKSKGMVYA